MSDDFIFHDQKRFGKDECQSIIDYFESNKSSHKEAGYLGKIDYSKKKFLEMGMDLRFADIKEFPSKLVPLVESIKIYKKKYSFLDETIPWAANPAFKIQKYNPGGAYFKLHCENDVPFSHPNSTRMIAWMVYLNDVTDDGHTEFPSQDKKFQPQCGDVLLWPAYWTHPHRGIPSKTQTKYILTGWFDFLGIYNE